MNARAPFDPAAVSAVNEVLDRLEPLAVTLANARGFRALLENLRNRDTSALAEAHISAIQLVRAGILRAAIGATMSALDKPGTDRASIGQITKMLALTDLSVLAHRWPDAAFGAATLQTLKEELAALVASPEFLDCKDFRDGVVGHTLVFALPIVPTEAYFRLHDEAEKLTQQLYAICGHGRPEFAKHRDRLHESANVFWDTYWRGMLA